MLNGPNSYNSWPNLSFWELHLIINILQRGNYHNKIDAKQWTVYWNKIKKPVSLTEVTPVMNAKHNGECRSWEKLPRVVLLVDVVEAMRRGEGESVPNLKK